MVAALALTLAACSGRATSPSASAPSSATIGQVTREGALAAGGRALNAAAIRSALVGRACSGEDAQGLFELGLVANGTGTRLASDGARAALAWRAERDRLCMIQAGLTACDSVVALGDGTLRLFDGTGRQVALLACG